MMSMKEVNMCKALRRVSSINTLLLLFLDIEISTILLILNKCKENKIEFKAECHHLEFLSTFCLCECGCELTGRCEQITIIIRCQVITHPVCVCACVTYKTS